MAKLVDIDPFSIMVSNGLRSSGGKILEDRIQNLSQSNSRCLYREMDELEPAVGGSMHFLRSQIKSLDHWLDPWDESPEAEDNREFIEGALEDMSHTLAAFYDNAASALLYGSKPFEVVYKKRKGDNPDKSMHSRFDDGKIGWRKLMPISVHAIDYWVFDDDDEVCGVWIDGRAFSSGSGERTGSKLLPIEKAFLVLAINDNENPEGKSIYQSVRKPYLYKKRHEENEGIKSDRGAGYPIVRIPEDKFVPVPGSDDPLNLDAVAAESDRIQLLENFRIMAKQIRTDKLMGAVFPGKVNCNGEETGYDIELLQLNVSTAVEDTIIKRYAQAISTAILFGLDTLGETGSGNRALGDTKLESVGNAIDAFMKSIDDGFTNSLFTRLLKLNGMDATKPPIMRHSKAKGIDKGQFGEMLKALAIAGVPLDSDSQRRAILDIAGLPEPEEGVDDEMEPEAEPPPPPQPEEEPEA